MLCTIYLAGFVAFAIVVNAGTIAQQTFDVNKSASPPSLDTFKQVHLSHSGLYLASPLSRNAPPHVSLHLHAPLYPVEDVRISIASIHNRTWEQVYWECGPIEGGSIEHCESDDKRRARSLEQPEPLAACSAAKVIDSQSRILIDAASCPALSSILSQDDHSTEIAEGYLESITIAVDVQRLAPVRRERHYFWIGRLYRPTAQSIDGGALWPYAGTATKGNDSTKVAYSGLVANRIDSLMQDPYLPRSYRVDSGDQFNGVDLTFASWSYGISIRAPNNGNTTNPPQGPPHEPVHSPIEGQVVWMGKYDIARAPDNGRNDEHEYGMMIRDEWGFVYQLLGLDEAAIEVSLGEQVRAGQHIAGTSRTLISREPLCRHRPADPPKMDDISRRYPLRNRLLRVVVARPDPSWSEWQAPYTSGWTYFNPLDAFTLAARSNDITPDSNPSRLFFAAADKDTALTTPRIVATSTDFVQPPKLSGKIEIIVAYDAFLDTPGDDGAQKAFVALHALDYAIVWPSEGVKIDAESGSTSCDAAPPDVDWRTAFDHVKMPNGWTVPLAKTNLLAHYVPAFTVGSVPLFRARFASQYDEKGRKLFYSPTRILNGQVDARGSWDTRKEPYGNGIYQVWIRGRDWFGNQGCIVASVKVQNGG